MDTKIIFIYCLVFAFTCIEGIYFRHQDQTFQIENEVAGIPRIPRLPKLPRPRPRPRPLPLPKTAPKPSPPKAKPAPAPRQNAAPPQSIPTKELSEGGLNTKFEINNSFTLSLNNSVASPTTQNVQDKVKNNVQTSKNTSTATATTATATDDDKVDATVVEYEVNIVETPALPSNGGKQQIAAQPKQQTPATRVKVGCYIASWYFTKPHPFNMDPTKVNPTLCDAYYWSFVFIGNERLVLHDQQEYLYDSDNKNYRLHFSQYQDLAFIQSLANLYGMKMHMAIGGPLQADATFEELFNDTSEDFTWQQQEFLQSHDHFRNVFDTSEVILDWRYPSTPKQFDNMLSFVVKSNLDNIIISVTRNENNIYGSTTKIYEAARVQIMAFDMFGDWPPYFIYHHSPWRVANNLDRKYSMRAIINEWLSPDAVYRAPRTIVTLPTYGRIIGCKDRNSCRLGQNGTKCDIFLSYTGEPCLIDTIGLCQLENNPQYNIRERWYDTQSHNLVIIVKNMASGRYNFISMEDEYTIAAKVRRIISKGITHINIWHLQNDDHNKYCSERRYPLTKAVMLAKSNLYLPGTSKDKEYPFSYRSPSCQSYVESVAIHSQVCSGMRYMSCSQHHGSSLFVVTDDPLVHSCIDLGRNYDPTSPCPPSFHGMFYRDVVPGPAPVGGAYWKCDEKPQKKFWCGDGQEFDDLQQECTSAFNSLVQTYIRDPVKK